MLCFVSFWFHHFLFVSPNVLDLDTRIGWSFVRVVGDWMTVSGDVWPIQQKGQAVSAARFAAVSFSYTPSSPNQRYRTGDELPIRSLVPLHGWFD